MFDEDSQTGKGKYSMDGGSTWQNFSSGGISEDTAVENISVNPDSLYTFTKDGYFWFSGTTSGRYDITIDRANYEDITIESFAGTDYTLRPINAGDTFRASWKTGTQSAFTLYLYPLS